MLASEALEIQNLVNKGTISDCEGLAEFADAAAAESGKNASAFIADFGLLTPSQLASILTPGVSTGNPSVPLNTGQQSGYLPPFQNTQPDNPYTNGDQGHHFAAFFQVGFFWGGAVAAALALDFEVLEAGGNFQNLNMGDIRLGTAAGDLGAAVRSGAISPSGVGAWIRQNLCAK
jgi:hypothetical protein